MVSIETPVSCYISFDDPRYQTLVLQGPFQSVGYSIDLSTGELRRVCICAAWHSSECCCGGFDREYLDPCYDI